MKASIAAVMTAMLCVGIGIAQPVAADVTDLTGAGAFGLSVNANGPGGATFTLGPIPSVDLPGGGGNVSTSAASASVPPVLSATVLNVSSQGGNLGSHAGFSTSTAQLAGADLLSGALTAEVLTATCTSNGDGSTGSTALANAQAGGSALALNPPPNTTIPVGTIGTVVLNEQIVTNTPGVETKITVNAVHITLNVDGFTGDVIISQARCRAAGPDVLIPPAPPGPPVPPVLAVTAPAPVPVVSAPRLTG